MAEHVPDSDSDSAKRIAFAQYLPHVTQVLDTVTTHAAALPDKSDLSFHRTLDRKLAKDLDEASAKVLAITERLLGLLDEGAVGKKGKTRRKMEDVDDVVDGYRRSVVDIVDGLLEDADSCLDSVNGQKKKAAIEVKPSAIAAAGAKIPGPFSASSSIPSSSKSPFPSIYSSNGLEKPQLDFPDSVDNSLARGPHVPHLPVKHHAMVPLGYPAILDYTIDPDPAKAQAQLTRERKKLSHPYHYETRNIQYPTWLFSTTTPIKPPPVEDVEAEWVDTPEALAAMVDELKQAKEIAVDLEHHDTHSYYGFTCLMQISTREQDWLVDTLALRGALREDKLGGVFADPSIIKVLHGADHDIPWLQKDFDIYIVNMFDTYQATRTLEMTSGSLSNLLKVYCGFTADKRYQMADWRVRPLTPAMRLYAQSDTHFLLYIFDHLRNALLEKSRPPTPTPELSISETSPEPSPATNPQRALRQVLEASSETSLKTYERELYDEVSGRGTGGWHNGAKKFLKGHDRKNTLVGHLWARLHTWRDRLARQLDESPYSVVTNDNLRTLALHPPQTAAAVRNIVSLRSKTGAQYATEIFATIQSATEEWNKNKGKRLPAETSVGRSALSPVDPSVGVVPLSPLTAASAPMTPGPTVVCQPAVAPEVPADLWDISEKKSVPRTTAKASTSKLFGDAASEKKKAGPAAPATGATIVLGVKRKTTSSLFGSADSKTRRATKAASPSFEEVQHSILEDIAPVAVRIEAKSTDEAATTTSTTPLANGNQSPPPPPLHIPEPETVPFVASGARTTTSAAKTSLAKKKTVATTSDEVGGGGVVTVKAIRKKKSNTVGAAPAESTQDAAATDTGSSSKKQPKEKKEKKKKIVAEDIPEFDYSGQVNLLDNPTLGRDKVKKTRKAKMEKRVVVTGSTFGKIPQDQSQPKAGNRSQTFH